VLAVARAHRYFPEDALNEIESFIADPIAWSAAHGGADKPKE
jgi:orotate phosphoribosyltransferase